MRIAVLIKNTHLHKSYGGMETQNKVLVEGLANLGHEVLVFTPAKEIKEANVVDNSVKYILVPCIFRKFSILYSWRKDDWFHKSFEYFNNNHTQAPFDIVLSQSSAGLGLFRNKENLGVKVISISHGSKMGEVISRVKSISSFKEVVSLIIDMPHIIYAFFFTQREFVYGSDKVIAVSTAVKNALVEETFVKSDKVVVINNGIKPLTSSEHLPAKLSNDVPHLIYVGRVIRAKGLFLLINVLSELRSMTWHLSIVGDGEDLSALSKKVTDLNLTNQVTFLGKLTHSEAMKTLLQADIFLLPSIRIEGLPMVLIEAMFAGLPVIATDVGGNADAVADGKTGYLVKSGSEAALKEKLVLMLNDSALRARMGRDARLIADQKFTDTAMIMSYLKVIKEVLDENS